MLPQGKLIAEFIAALSSFERIQKSDWQDLASLLDDIGREISNQRNRQTRRQLERETRCDRKRTRKNCQTPTTRRIS